MDTTPIKKEGKEGIRIIPIFHNMEDDSTGIIEQRIFTSGYLQNFISCTRKRDRNNSNA
jgi:hypothetical protein